MHYLIATYLKNLIKKYHNKILRFNGVIDELINRSIAIVNANSEKKELGIFEPTICTSISKNYKPRLKQ
ncbi:hypothetical protein MTsPCn5_28860 [Croceitalea sp. MTPC5]|nr:hypothetical protein MTsPCn5_28860 [Croceitalea sp. MTPC5]